MAWIVLKQIAEMFILIFIGFCMYKAKLITNEGARVIGKILIYLSLPCVIMQGFFVDRTAENVRGLAYSALLGFLAILLSVVVSAVLFRGDTIATFASTFPNPGFFGITIVIALFGQSAVFYMSALMTFMNLTQWSYGVNLLQLDGKKGKLKFRDFLPSPKRILRAPFLVAALLGLAVFGFAVPIPSVVRIAVSDCAAVNTPLAMFSVGCYLAQTDLARIFTRGKLYVVTAVRMLLIPFLEILLFKYVLPFGSEEIRIVLLISMACPVGTNIAVYAGLYDKDYRYAVETIVNSTLLSIVTLPLIVRLAELML